MPRPVTLTALNGASIKVDYDDLESFGTHNEGGSFVRFKGNSIRVQESTDQILSLAKVVQ